MAVPAPSFDAAITEVIGLTQKEIVKLAKSLHADVMQTPPRPVSFKRRVDGREAPEEAVKINGVIVYDYNRLDLVADLAMAVLLELSPERSGEYKRAHRIISKSAEEVRIANTVEYSRVIETASRGTHTLRIQKGGHVYERAARRLRNMPDVANSVRVSFTYTQAAGPPTQRGHHAARAAQWPTLILTAR